MHAIHDPFSLESWSVGTLSLEKEYQGIVEKAKAELDGLIEDENEKGVRVKKLLREGEPIEEILKVVEKRRLISSS